VKSRSFPALAATIVMLFATLAVGVWAFSRQIVQGDVVTGMRTIGAGGAAWGLYVVMDGFFLGAGVAVMACACVARFSRDRDMEAVARIAMPVAITCFLGAALCVLVDQGRPPATLRDLALLVRPRSPMFVTFTGVGAVCLFASLVHCVLSRRPDLAEYAKRPSAWRRLQRLFAAGYRGTAGERYRRRKVGFWMSLFMLPALLAPLTALAIIFTVRLTRPLPLTLLEVAIFLLLSGAGGIAILLASAALVGRLAGRQAGLAARGFGRLGTALMLVLSLSLPSVVAAEIAGLSSDEPAVLGYARALLADDYGPLFWCELGCLFLATAFLWRGARRGRLGPRVTVSAGLLTQTAVFLHHYLLLVAWQTHGLALPYQPGAYSPTWIECAVVLGIAALCLLLLLPAVRLIPFAPLARVSLPAEGRVVDRSRSLLTLLWFTGGLAIAVVGFALSARVGTESFLDPVLVGSPVVFIVGLMVLATTGAVYELLPERGWRRALSPGPATISYSSSVPAAAAETRLRG
jgi:Ni/Fe-hydrogenase subunit HybB-like protein